MQEAPDPARRGACARPALLLALLLFAPMLFARTLLPPDEPRYADVALAMLESGDWLVPQLHQKSYFEKPPVFFWIVAALGRLGVPIEIAPRLVALLAALGIVAALPALARRVGIAAASARRGTLVLVTLPLFAIYAQLGFLDQLLALEITLVALCRLTRTATPAPGRGASLGLALGEGLLLGAALLTKGPVALLFALGVPLGAMFARKEPEPAAAPPPGRFTRLDLPILATALLIGLCWLDAVAARAGAEYVDRILWGQLERRIGGLEDKHRVPPGFLLAVIALGALPWTLLAFASRVPWRWRDAWRPPARCAALLGWAVIPAITLAGLPTQQPHYALPALPPLALLAGEALGHPLRAWGRAGAATCALVVAAALLALAAIGALGLEPPSFHREFARLLGRDHLLAAALAFAGACLVVTVAWRSRSAVNAPLRAVAGLGGLLMILPIVAWRIDPLLCGTTVLEADAVAQARRIVAPTGLRSALRVRTRLPDVEEFLDRSVASLVAEDPERLVIEWRKHLERSGVLERVRVVGHGWLLGRELLAVRGPLRPPAGPTR